MRITEPSNDDYDNDVSDNCDHNFGVKNDQKVSLNMILMSKNKGQHGGKKIKKIRARPLPLFGQCPKEKAFSFKRCSLKRASDYQIRCPLDAIFLEVQI